MNRKFTLCYILIVAAILQCGVAFGQFSSPATDTTGKRLDIIRADRYNYQQIDTLGDFISLAGNVRLKQENTLFDCDSAVLNQKANVFEAFGNIHINDGDSIDTYSKYLQYFGKDKRAILKNNVRLTDGKGVLTTNELEYNTLTKLGIYKNGGKVVNGKTVLTSKEGFYYGETKDVYFKKNVVLVDPEFRITTDTMLYNTYTEIVRFVAPTTIKSKQRNIVTSEGFYDMKNKKAVFGRRPFIDDKDYTLSADDIALDEESGFGDALGNAVYKSKDTASGTVIIANRLQSNNKTGALLATQKPLMILKQGADSIYIAADTLYSAKLSSLRETRTVPDISQAGLQSAEADSSDIGIPDSIKNTQPKGLPVSRMLTTLAPATKDKTTITSDNQKLNITDSFRLNPDTLLAANKVDTVSVARQPNRPNTRDNKVEIAANDKNSFKAKLKSVVNSTDTSNSRQNISLNDSAAAVPLDSISLSNKEGMAAGFNTPTTNDTTNKDTSTTRFIEAYYNVRIFSDSLQSVCDSLFYSLEDSAFRLFTNPIVWAQDNQITGDTIYLFTKNKKADRLYVFENALAVNKADQFYNQVKGNTLNGYFENGDISYIKAKGSAENIYYGADEEGKFFGVNRATSDIIDMYFADRKPQRVVFRNNLKGTTSPMRQVNHEEMRLRGFKWYDDRRPKTKTELFGN